MRVDYYGLLGVKAQLAFALLGLCNFVTYEKINYFAAPNSSIS
jgi:hypothetical protein